MTEAWFTSAHAPPEPHVPAGWRVMKFDSLDSTNAALRRIVEMEGDVAEGILLFAKTQTAGRGRLGRTWESPEGNVYASVLVGAPEDKALGPQVGLVATVAAADAILDFPRHNTAPPALSHKWPNDVLIEGKKVCGILPETVTDPDGRDWIIVGIGINLRPVTVEDAIYPVGSLIEQHVDTTPEHALTIFSRAFAERLAAWREQGFSAVRDAWMQRAPTAGTPVAVGLPDGRIEGRFAGLDDDGALLLDTSEGGRKRILAGDVLGPGGAA